MVGGTYTIREDQYPEGYEEMLAEFTFKVGYHGEIIPQGTYDESIYDVSFDGDTAVATITVTDPATHLRILKTDSTGTPLQGAVFEVTPDATSTWAGGGRGPRSFTSDSNGIVDLEAVLDTGGTYTLTEVTAPEGYELAGSVTFTVADNGTVEIAGATDGRLGRLHRNA